jgi:RNA polymerase sigma factor (sigma-70 family)
VAPGAELEPFERIVARHGPAVLRVCRAVLGPDAAEDAWSETFLSALQAYPDLRPGSNVEAWLVTIAHRKAIDQLRARSRRAVPAGELPDRPGREGLPGASDSDLWAALRALPLRQRASVAYHYLVGLPYADVAVILGGTAEAARRAAADGIAALRKTYTRDTAGTGPNTAAELRLPDAGTVPSRGDDPPEPPRASRSQRSTRGGGRQVRSRHDELE